MSILRIGAGTGCTVGGIASCSRNPDTSATVSQGQRYDQFQFSSCLDATEKRVKQAVGHMSQEIRSRVSAQDLEHLRQQVSDGTYQPNPREIAARMLLMKEGG